jgi:hypothetical protein
MNDVKVVILGKDRKIGAMTRNSHGSTNRHRIAITSIVRKHGLFYSLC